MRRLSSLGLLVLLACGSKTDPGGGTQTLTALIEVVASPERTLVEVDLRAGMNPIATADVQIEDVDRGNQTTAEGDTGSFRARFNGYARTVRVELSTPDGDRLYAQLEGPAPHVLTRPSEGVTVRRGDFETLKVTWDRDQPAEAVELEAGDGGPLRLEGDPGEAELPLGPLLNGPQTLTVRRETTVDLAGGIPGSTMRSRYEASATFTLTP